MDKKLKLENNGGDRAAAHEESRSKEAALDKLRQMEWARNKQDSWHSAGSNSRSCVVQEKKKYNNVEDNYFNGTGSQKNKKSRKPRPENTTQPIVPPGFTVSAGPSTSRPVNAWMQKRGSALFNKQPQEVDEEDEDVKLALKLSLKSHEEDEQRRLRMFNEGLPKSMKSKICAEREWEEHLTEEEYSTRGEKQPSISSVPFIDIDSTEQPPVYNQRRELASPRTRNTSGQRDKFHAPPVVIRNDTDFSEPSHSRERFPPPPVNNASYKQSTEFDECSAPPVLNNTEKEKFKPSWTYENPTQMLELNKAILIPEKFDKLVPSASELCANLKSTLTFGDTQGLLEKMQDDNSNNSPVLPQSHECESPSYSPNMINNSLQMSVLKSPSSSKVPSYSNNSETDQLIHSYLKHDLQYSLTQTTKGSDILSLNGLEQYLVPQSTHFEQHHSLLNAPVGNSQSAMVNSNSLDSSSSMSDSPLRNSSPYSSDDNQISSSLTGSFNMSTQSGQFPFPCPINVQGNQEVTNNLQAIHLANHNLQSQMVYPTVPPGYVGLPHNQALQGMVPLNPQLNQISGLPQYCLPNSNMIIPSLHGQDLLNTSTQLYQMQRLVDRNVFEFQQTQLAALLTSDSAEPPLTNAAYTQSQAMSMQNQTQMLQTQSQQELANVIARSKIMSLQNQLQMVQTQFPLNIPQMVQAQNQPQLIQTQNQTQMIPTQYQPQIMQTQNQPRLIQTQNQPQMIQPQNQPHMIKTQNQTQMITSQCQLQKISTQNQPQMIPSQNQPQMVAPQNQLHMVPTQNQLHIVPTQNQFHMVPSQNQIHMVPSQNQIHLIQTQSQPQMIAKQESSLPKQNVFTNEYQHQTNSQNQSTQGMPQSDKSKGEMLQQLMEPPLNQVQQEILPNWNAALIQSIHTQIPQPQSYVYPPHLMAVGLNHLYAGMPAMSHIPQQLLSQQVPVTGQLSPNAQQGSQIMASHLNMDPELNIAQEPVESKIIQGSGKLH